MYNPIEKHDNWLLLWHFFKQDAAPLKRLQAQLGYRFTTESYLFEALTHRTALFEFNMFRKNKGEQPLSLPWNEKIEFLGDAVLNMSVSSMLWKNKEHYNEGQLSKMRSSLVNEKTLAEIARKLDVYECILIGKAEKNNNTSFSRNALLADTFEAILGAIYLDSSFQATAQIIEPLFIELVKKDIASFEEDYKSLLQELMQDQKKKTPIYKTISEHGLAHEKEFEVGVFLDGQLLGKGSGKNKKIASQEAAKNALKSKENIG